jgi:hypothetical protein
VSPSKDAFFEMSEYKQSIVRGLEEGNCVDDILEAVDSDPYQLSKFVLLRVCILYFLTIAMMY